MKAEKKEINIQIFKPYHTIPFRQYEKYRIEPTYLVTGDTNHKVDIELFLANCSREERDAFIDRMLAYMRKLMTGR